VAVPQKGKKKNLKWRVIKLNKVKMSVPEKMNLVPIP